MHIETIKVDAQDLEGPTSLKYLRELEGTAQSRYRQGNADSEPFTTAVENAERWLKHVDDNRVPNEQTSKIDGKSQDIVFKLNPGDEVVDVKVTINGGQADMSSSRYVKFNTVQADGTFSVTVLNPYRGRKAVDAQVVIESVPPEVTQ